MIWILLLAAGLYVASGFILFLEVFVPSGGLLTVCSLASLIAGVWLCFRHGPNTGWIGLIEALVVVPSVFGLSLKLLPKTRFGRGVTLVPPQRPMGDGVPDAPDLEGLVGKKGLVVTPLRPVGICEIDGKRVECIAEGGYLGAGVQVEAIAVQAAQLLVRPVRA